MASHVNLGNRQFPKQQSNRLMALTISGLMWRNGVEEQFTSDDIIVNEGKLVLLIGRNGVGKTTLLEKLAGLRDPEQLNIAYGNEKLWQDEGRRRRKLNGIALHSNSYACQNAEQMLFARSVEEELHFSLKAYRSDRLETDKQIAEALKAVGWNHTWLSRDPYQLSGGERRRCALASVFATPASWLLLDEPTAGLDGEGHQCIGQALLERKRSGTGMMLISHDLDWALPLADSVLLLAQDGTVRLCSPEQLLAHPHWLAEIDMEVPGWLEVGHELWMMGVPAQQIWQPQEAAVATFELVKHQPALQEQGVTETRQKDTQSQRVNEISVEIQDKQDRHKIAVPMKHRLGAFDPRAIWLGYLLLSIGLFAQVAWVGVAIGAVVVGACLSIGRISLWRWRKLIITYGVISIFASAVFAAGMDGYEITVDLSAFQRTLLSFSRTMLVLLLGLSIPLVMTPLSLRRALDQLLRVRGRTFRIIDRFILTVTLMIRFIPVLIQEWNRFSRIYLSRGKAIGSKPWRFIVQLSERSIPFLLAMFRLGDEVAVALESRGVSLNHSPTRVTVLRFKTLDYVFVTIVMLVATSLWVIARKLVL
ncbi:MAG: ATP-binding cassette domain-containing protein [Candidatus Cohnella colombiensis]|uniref:ATP-binding cassette domain-containing protein n=1 Tax=Candidatus Cohnella colombiensis TaxID=3121368 RepID=A0AA95JEH9_9BACL|nr:MAG: ATP-binding cassette domain-containing protein [Cohnella sp.]